MAEAPKTDDRQARNSSITDFKAQLTGGGARPNLFYVEFTDLFTEPLKDEDNADLEGDALEKAKTSNTAANDQFSYLCKAAQIPASIVASIDVPFRGRILKVAGDRTFEPWTITVINDQNFNVREKFEKWMQSIAQYTDASGFSKPDSYFKTAKVKQLGKGGENGKSDLNTLRGVGLKTIKEYKFYDIFPTNLGAIELNYESTNAIEEFTVELQVNYWESI